MTLLGAALTVIIVNTLITFVAMYILNVNLKTVYSIFIIAELKNNPFKYIGSRIIKFIIATLLVYASIYTLVAYYLIQTYIIYILYTMKKELNVIINFCKKYSLTSQQFRNDLVVTYTDKEEFKKELEKMKDVEVKPSDNPPLSG